MLLTSFDTRNTPFDSRAIFLPKIDGVHGIPNEDEGLGVPTTHHSLDDVGLWFDANSGVCASTRSFESHLATHDRFDSMTSHITLRRCFTAAKFLAMESGISNLQVSECPQIDQAILREHFLNPPLGYS